MELDYYFELIADYLPKELEDQTFTEGLKSYLRRHKVS